MTSSLQDSATLGLKHGLNLLVDYDPRWPAAYAAEEERILAAMGDRVMAIEHYGSTSIQGLRAKPIIDILVLASARRRVDPVQGAAGQAFWLRLCRARPACPTTSSSGVLLQRTYPSRARDRVWQRNLA